jgi:two-component system NtrC family sensor kinase
MRESLADKIAQLDQANSNLSRRNAELESAMGELRKAQEELVQTERMAVTGKMAAQLSHEINNPIHNTQSLLESSLRRIQVNDQTRELIGLALEEVTRMTTLTRQLLDVYRGTVIETAMESVDLASLLREVTRSHRETLARERVELLLETADPLPMICGVRDKLKQVFLNLLLNARDAMPEGGTVRITAEACQSQVVVKVADTGVGIPPEDLNKIFDAFFTTKKEVSGVGLGLSVTYGIIRQHKGEIDVTSTIGKGTTFTIRFPEAKADDDSYRKA